MALTIDQLRHVPKVALHDHLDGGLRSQTLIEHCREMGHELPTTDAAELATWFFDAADSGSLERYLETFVHTIAAMQTPEHLKRVGREFVLDQAEDGVVYAEARWAPEQHLSQGLTMAEAVAAVQEGIEEGITEVRSSGREITVRQILTAMRHAAPTREVAELVADGRGVIAGFDIAGAEAGFPPSRHLASFDYLKRQNCFFTIHAGEAFGLPSIWEAVQVCGAHRLGHGVRLVDDIELVDGEYQLGPLASYIRDTRVPLEICPTSNVQTGVCDSIAEHPFDLLQRLMFRVTVSSVPA